MYLYVERVVCFILLLVFLSDSNADEISETLSEIKRELAKLSVENTELKSEIRDLKVENNQVSESLMDTRLRLYKVEEFCSQRDDNLPDRTRRIISPTMQNTLSSSSSNNNDLPNLFYQMENVLIQLKDRVTVLEHDLSQHKHENQTLFSENVNLKLQTQSLEFALRNVNLKLGSQATTIVAQETKLAETKRELDNLVASVHANATMALENCFNTFNKDLSQLTQTVQGIEAKQQVTIKRNVAFHVRLMIEQQHMVIHQTVAFTHVLLNEGSGWDEQSHVFRAPVSGLYYFSSNIMSDDYDQIEVELVKGGVGVSVIYVGDRDTWAVGALSAVMHLSVGDEVWIRIYNNKNVNIGNIAVYGGGHSWFSGFLI